MISCLLLIDEHSQEIKRNPPIGFLLVILFLIVFFIYHNRKKIIDLIQKYYTIIRFKMNNSHICRLQRDLKNGDYQRVLDEIIRMESSGEMHSLSEEEKQVLSNIKKEADIEKLRNEIKSFLQQSENYISMDKPEEAVTELDEAKKRLEFCNAEDKKAFEKQIRDQEGKVVELRFKKEVANINNNIDNGEWNQMISKYKSLKEVYDKDKLNIIKEKMSQRAEELYAKSDLSELLGLMGVISKDEAFTEIATNIKDKLETQIKSFLNKKDYAEAESLLTKRGAIFDESKKKELQENIEQQEKNDFEEIVNNVEKALEIYDIERASKLINEAQNNPKKDEAALTDLNKKVQQTIAVLAKEKEFEVPQPLYGVGKFNIPKPNTEGEDAEPYVFVDSSRNWGVIGAFDGMGGAGARKYSKTTYNTSTNKEEPETHTSAYWGAKFVREAVEEMINQRLQRHKGEHPIKYIESHLYNDIKDKLDKEIESFPEAKIKSPTKMVRKLPTTMALCVYFINNGIVTVNCYWAGDSRVYLYNGDKAFFLTRDDANAPDNDPFSPANMDLAMNNTICQDQDFRINKYTRDFKLDKSKPFVIIAATDGCFGYFKNPIEFEYNIRKTLYESDSWNIWNDRIIKAIYDNGQQDDYSMTLVVIGCDESEFCQFRETMIPHLKKRLFIDYYEWKGSKENEKESLENEIGDCTNRIAACKKEKDGLIKKREDIDKILGNIDSIPDAAVKTDLEKAIQEIKNCKEKYTNLEKEEDGKSTKIEIELSAKKANLDNLLLAIERENNHWYETYKRECVEMADNNMISFLN